MEPPSTDQSQDSLEVDVNLLMQQRLPRYVVNCLQAAGYDELEVIASIWILMKVRQAVSVKLRSILKDIIKVIQICYQAILQNPVLHCHLNFRQDIAFAYVILFKKSSNYIGIPKAQMFQRNILGWPQERGLNS